ncbi:hypothetical protein AGMMS49965_25910 [Bacteroidia bacterium]|nr:hypothetical protein AGMMS49965_25910 [Bacteroidia bacterium]
MAKQIIGTYVTIKRNTTPKYGEELIGYSDALTNNMWKYFSGSAAANFTLNGAGSIALWPEVVLKFTGTVGPDGSTTAGDYSSYPTLTTTWGQEVKVDSEFTYIKEDGGILFVVE